MWKYVPEPTRDAGEIWLAPADHSEISVDLSLGREGDVEASRRLLRRFCSAVTKRKQIDDRIIEHLCQSFLDILDNDSAPGRALKLTKKRGGQKNPDHTERNLRIWRDMRKQIENGSSVENASLIVGEKYCRSGEAIRQVYKDMKKLKLELIAEGREVTEEEWNKLNNY